MSLTSILLYSIIALIIIIIYALLLDKAIDADVSTGFVFISIIFVMILLVLVLSFFI